MNARANKLAHYLRDMGVGPDILVGMYMERSLEMVVGLLGVLKAGGAYVPLDPVYPMDRLAVILEDSQVPILLTQEKLLGNLPEHKARTICPDRDWEAISRESEENPDSGVTPENLIYVIYTSGSTGKPKGVLISHCNVARLFTATEPWYSFDEHDVWTLFHSYAFDFSVWELWGALIYGGRLVVVPYLTSRSFEAFYELLHTERVTVLNQTPTAFRQLIQAEEFLDTPKDLALRLVIFGGEALELQSLRPWFERHGDRKPRLVNMYGITETTVHVTYRPLTIADLEGQPGSMVGRPIPDLRVYVLDQNRKPVPIGVHGEMFVGGHGLARGYLNRPELTGERFVADPFTDNPEDRLYVTGDLARYRPNGDLEYLGRLDHQVQIRGFRVELGEIETVLTEHPAVRETIIMVREYQDDDKRLIAYLVPNRDIAASELRNYLRKSLPDYMLPSDFVMLKAIPLTPNGKVDRRALPEPETFGVQEDYVPPRNSDEEKLVAVWTEVLGVKQVGVNDNFFDLGGHSLLAVRLVNKISKEQNISVPLSALFQSPTIGQLARFIRRQKPSDVFTPLVEIQPDGKNIPFFCVHPGDGNVFCYTELARHLGESQPLYGLQAFGLEPGTAALSRLEDMASEYIEALRSVHPKGPYRIGGFCGGGSIAYEMAQQLNQQEEQVDILVLIDSLAPHLYNPVDEPRQFMAFARDFDGLSNTNLLPLFCEMLGIDLKDGIEGVHREIQSLSNKERLSILWECAQKKAIFPEDVDSGYLERLFKIHRGINLGLVSYNAKSYDGHAVLLRAVDSVVDQKTEEEGIQCAKWFDDPASSELIRKFREDPLLGWGELASVDAYDVPGNHFTMLSPPHVNIVAKMLKHCLQNCV